MSIFLTIVLNGLIIAIGFKKSNTNNENQEMLKKKIICKQYIKLTFPQAIVSFFTRAFDYKGESSCKEYWTGLVITYFFLAIIAVVYILLSAFPSIITIPCLIEDHESIIYYLAPIGAICILALPILYFLLSARISLFCRWLRGLGYNPSFFVACYIILVILFVAAITNPEVKKVSTWYGSTEEANPSAFYYGICVLLNTLHLFLWYNLYRESFKLIFEQKQEKSLCGCFKFRGIVNRTDYHIWYLLNGFVFSFFILGFLSSCFTLDSICMISALFIEVPSQSNLSLLHNMIECFEDGDSILGSIIAYLPYISVLIIYFIRFIIGSIAITVRRIRSLCMPTIIFVVLFVLYILSLIFGYDYRDAGAWYSLYTVLFSYILFKCLYQKEKSEEEIKQRKELLEQRKEKYSSFFKKE